MLNQERPVGSPHNAAAWGSDVIADLLRSCGFPWISLTPGASFRGLHDSLVNHLGNKNPQILLCVHEENAVAIAHGWAKVTGRAMPVVLHSNVGLMHATMAIFNAWCDRAPVLILGAQGPMDAVQRRPWVDWLHTARDLGALVRGYVKWDDQPASVGAAVESVLRALIIAETAPTGPTYVCLDSGLQEEPLREAVPIPPVARFQAPSAPRPDPASIGAAAQLLMKARRPVILIGRTTRDRADWDARVELAERLDATVITDLRAGASFPTRHPLHPFPPGLYLDRRAVEAIGAADVVLSLDWIDLAGTLRQAGGGRWPPAKIIQCSVDHYSHNGWSMDHLGLPPADLRISATPEAMVSGLLGVVGPVTAERAGPRPSIVLPEPPRLANRTNGLDVDLFSTTVAAGLAPHRPSYIRLSIGWPGRMCEFDDPLDYLGFDGGGGIGSGPGMAVGAALALRGSGRLPVAVTGDGDFLMGLTALWTAAHYRIPLLVIVSNNSSFFNDEVHQEAVARRRNRPLENRWIGLRMTDPDFDLAMLSRGQGVEAFGPVSTAERLKEAIAAAVAIVKQGRPCVIDARVAPGYDRSVTSGTRGR